MAHYRIKPPRPGFGLMDAVEFMAAIFAECPSKEPDHPSCHTGEWYCMNQNCVVREVRVLAKYLDGAPPKQPPAMKCPVCSKAMKFHGYLREVELEPCEPASGCIFARQEGNADG
jgi:hypothetical protein